VTIRSLLLFGVLAAQILVADEYTLGPDSQRHDGVPRGSVTQSSWTSKIYPGTVRDYWLYVPAQYDAAKPACVMIFQDGGGFAVSNTEHRAVVAAIAARDGARAGHLLRQHAADSRARMHKATATATSK